MTRPGAPVTGVGLTTKLQRVKEPTIPAFGFESTRTPHYAMVPKTVEANLAFRERVVRLGSQSKAHARTLSLMCKQDPLFWLNVFSWTYDPRKEPGAIPFITYEYQDEAVIDLLDAIGNHDILIEKSRDMGASWLNICAITWLWHFHKRQSFLMVSRNEDYVDKPGNPKALFWKVDFLIDNEPGWLRPNLERTRLHLLNTDTQSVIDGESTTGDVARGDRRTAILMDEYSAFAVDDGYKALASTGDVTRCRIFNFTPQGTGNAAFDMAQSDIKKLRMHWTRHPDKAKGLWYDAEGRPRSPWYDDECRRRPIPMLIAQELDIDYLGSSHVFFDRDVMGRVRSKDVLEPLARGELGYDQLSAQPGAFGPSENGGLLLWAMPEVLHGGGDEFVVAADVATGTGASNSCIVAGNKRTGTKVLEYANPNIKPHELARLAVALARWLNNGLLIWEANGPGRIFGDQVIDLGYRHVYYRANDRALGKPSSTTPGWYATREGKLGLLGEYRRALGTGEFIERSKDAAAECLEYVFQPNGSVEHSRSVSTIDPTGARENHGDRVIATALLWKGIKEVPAKPQQTALDAPSGSMMFRRAQALRDRKKKNFW